MYPSSFLFCRIVSDHCFRSSTSALVKKFIKFFPASGSFQTGDSSPTGIGCRGSKGDGELGCGDSGDSSRITCTFMCRGPPLLVQFQNFPRSRGPSHCPPCKNCTLTHWNLRFPAPNFTPLAYSAQCCCPLPTDQ